ncbi:MAG: ATP-binding protein [Rhodanobacter sp.]
MARRVWTGVGDWLKRVPVLDPVDRHNAPLMQMLLICVGLMTPLNKVVLFSQPSFRYGLTSPALIVDAVTDLMILVAAWASLFCIRRGEFRRGVSLFLTVMMVAGLLAYAVIGMKRLYADPFPLLLLGLAGLMLGRRALWTVYGALMLMFILGAVSDEFHDAQLGTAHWQWSFSPTIAVGYLVVAIVLDRTIGALRETLAVSNARGLQLERSNRRLAQEMIERERTAEHLVHAQKMEAVGRVASGVAHDFDNILGVILGYTARRERLADGGVAPLVGAMEGIQTAAERATLISRQLLGFSRHDRRHAVAMDLLDVLQEVTPMLRQLFAAQTRVSVSLPDQPAWIEMDRGQLELILLSIASNARDAMPDGGQFSVRATVRGDDVVIELSDSGNGVAATDAAHIFEPFFTTKPIGSGTGLGLSVARDVLIQAGGEISVRSKTSEGATFVLRIPRVQSPVASVQDAAVPANT